ncbi:MAG: hypothetical protein QM368_05685 [Bacillota bacterium]|nr:hypothetical protein [Bacillota bacterium]
MKPENKIRFKSVEDAKAQGYSPCSVCNQSRRSSL